jgi:pentatricopeptide repeat protein
MRMMHVYVYSVCAIEKPEIATLRMQECRNPRSRDLLLSLLRHRSSSSKHLPSIREAHAAIVKIGFESISLYADHVIRSLASCGSFAEALHVFGALASRTVYTWHAIISASVKLGDGRAALCFFDDMSARGIPPDRYVFTCCIKACGLIKDVRRAMLMHRMVTASGFDSSEAVGSALIHMYTMCDQMDEGLKVFKTLSCRDVVTWETLMSGLIGSSEHIHAIVCLFEEMLVRERIEPTRVGYFSVLKACRDSGDIGYGMHVHSLLVENAARVDPKVANTLIDMYASDVTSLDDAYKVFVLMPHPDIVSWCVIIDGYAQHDRGDVALALLEKMLALGVKQDKAAFLCLLKACSTPESLWHGRMIHHLIIQSGMISDVVLINTLTDMYGKCGCITEAWRLFNGLRHPTEVSCNVMIGIYAQEGDLVRAMDIYKYMRSIGLVLTMATYISLLKACKSVGSIEQGRMIHAEMIKRSLVMDVMIGNTLMDMYGKAGCLLEAFNVFEGMVSNNKVSWGILITASVEHECDLLALSCFQEMFREGTWPDKVTFLSIAKACGRVGALKQGMQIHGQIVISGIDQDEAVNNSLISMYCKCAAILEANKIFTCLPSKDIASWGMMLSGYALYGCYDLAHKHLQAMQCDGIKMNDIVFTSILSTCSHAGVWDMMDHTYFEHIYGISNDQSNGILEHYSCIIDNLGRSGHLHEAKSLLHTMPVMPNDVSRMGVLSSSNTYGSLQVGHMIYS